MKRTALPLVIAMFACLCLPAAAIERNAHTIDRIGISYSEVNDADIVCLNLWGETALQPEGGPWSILLGGSFGDLAGEMDSDGDTWSAGLGIKYYLFPVTSVALRATYAEISWDVSHDVRGLEAELIHRFVPATKSFSPFVRGQMSWEEQSRFSGEAMPGEDTTGVGFEVAGGADFASNEELSFVLEVAVMEGENVYGGIDLSDGWSLSFWMKYYWE
jgi:hypothetical protein